MADTKSSNTSGAEKARKLDTAGERERKYVFFIPAAAVVIGIFIYISDVLALKGVHWVSEPMHSLLGGMGAFSAVVLAFLFLFTRSDQLAPRRRYEISSGLLAMGILTGLHASLPAGNIFVWLRAFSTVVGGAFFAMIVIPEKYWPPAREKRLPVTVAAVTLVLGLVSTFFPHTVPPVLMEGGFAPVVGVLNMIGGVFYFVAGGKFFLDYQEDRKYGNAILMALSFFSGIAGLVFVFSSIWGIEWWIWHVLLVVPYIAALVAVLFLYRKMEVELAVRSSEQKFTWVVENAMEGVWILDAAGATTFANERMAEILGYSREEMIGRHLLEFMDPSAREEVERLMRRRSEGIAETHEFTFLRKDGNEVHTVLRGVPIMSPDGVFSGAIGLVSDLTDIRKAEQELEEAENRIRQMQKLEALGRLAGGIAHDFNNTLTVILGYCEMLKAEMSGRESGDRKLDAIARAAEHATALTGQLLAFSRRQVMSPKVLDINEVISDQQGMLRSLIGEHINLKFVPGEKLGKVMADPSQIIQVIMNLAINAKDAMPEGGDLTIETRNTHFDLMPYGARRFADVGRYVLMSVSDTGVGMNEEVQAHIFDPFFTTKGEGSGTGLGLAVVYGIVKQSGGVIWVESDPGKGAKFSVFLPRMDETRVKLEEEPSAKPGVSSPGHETILVVEDEAEVRRVVSDMLRIHGYKVLEAEGEGEAMEMASQEGLKIDLLLTDMVMPGAGGIKLAEAFRGRHPRARIVYMSGHTEKAALQPSILPRGGFFIAKPFDSEALNRKIREALDSTLPGG